MNLLLFTIILPAFIGLIVLLTPKKFRGLIGFLSIITALVTFILNILVFIRRINVDTGLILMDNLSRFIFLAIGIFGFLIILYSLKYTSKVTKKTNKLFSYMLLTLSASYGVIAANNLILLSVFWGFLGMLLYLLINFGKDANKAANKAFILIGGSDTLMFMGLGVIYVLSQSFSITEISISLKDAPTLLPIIAFLTLVFAAFAKAGAMPLHTWVPDMSEKAPIPVTAFLPASLDKLLGIYLLARICMDIFILNRAMTFLLLLLGSLTIVAAVFMAIIQHDLRKLLSYHAVSQVGYMVIGIAIGTPIAIAGGLFHMLNNTIYKSSLFLSAGAVKYNTGTTDMDKLGGLAKVMPVTFIATVIASLSISGVPPFNGFVSKWMVYQGLIDFGKAGNNFWVVWLVAAMFGSALTLASFMKLLHAVFLGEAEKKWNFSEVHWSMYLPMIILSILCIGFGIFAISIPLKYFILPTLGSFSYPGFWSPGIATLLIITGIVVGLLIYVLGKMKVREDDPFIGGEVIPSDKRVTGTGFYNSVSEISIFSKIYKMAEKKYFDIYEVLKKFSLSITNRLRLVHSGKLISYLLWTFLGMAILFILIKIRG